MNIILKIAYSFIFLLTSYVSFSQDFVTEVTYYMEYDTSTCWYDCFIIIEAGGATGAGFRTQFFSNYTIVAPTGTTVIVADTYLPLKDNQNYTGTIPATWNIGASEFDVNGTGIDYHPIVPQTSPSAQYNDLVAGDTLKVFSINVSDNTECGIGVRFFQNGVDMNVGGGNVNSSFKIGTPIEQYEGNNPIQYPTGPYIPTPIVNVENGISIDFTPNTISCQAPFTQSWSGPNNYSSTNEDVLINPAVPADYGVFQLILENEIECKDTLDILVEEPSAPVINDVNINSVKLTPTFEHIGVHVDITGDDNNNSELTLEYKLTGKATYLPGAITMRAQPNMVVDGAPLNMNFHAGSVMHLLPNASYDVRLTMTDIDGGSEVIELSITTKQFPDAIGSGDVKYVITGNGGGNGSIANPFQGLQFAVDNVQSGEILEVADGLYESFTLTTTGTETNPITIRSTNIHGAVIDGNNTITGIVTLGSATDSIRYIIIDGFEIKNGDWGIDAQNTQFVTIRNNKINDVDFGFYNRRENGWEHDQYLNNNEIIGRTSWPQLDGSIPSERGIDIRGNANVISNNSISDFGDGISTDGPVSQNSYALDIHDNYITRIVDDIIEVDGAISNTRVYKNQGLNGRMGVSVAPIFGGPVYIFRNEFFNLETSAFKMNNQTAGLIIINNSIASSDRGLTSSEGWQSTIFKNNAVLSGHYVMEEFGLVTGSIDDWDNNAYLSLRAGTTAEPWFKWDGVKYNTVTDVVLSGITELNTIETSYTHFINIIIPSNYSTEALPTDFNFELSVNSGLINIGVAFDNIFDNDSEGGTVAIGALEQGTSSPNYGHDFENICERNDLSSRIWNGNINKGWYHPSNWTPCGVPEKITDVTIPGTLVNYPFINSDIIAKNAFILGNGQLEITTDINFKLEGDL